MVTDLTLFFNELELLEIRLAELYPVVDRFVIVESGTTFSGRPKPFHFAENRARFEAFEDKITYLTPDLPPGPDNWERENFAREVLRAYEVTTAHDNDILIMSDLDEIPSRTVVDRFRSSGLSIAGIGLRTHWFYFNYWCPRHDLKDRPKIFRGSILKRHTAKEIRYMDAENQGIVIHGGWNFCFMGGPQRIAYKAESTSHANEEGVKEFAAAYRAGTDPLVRDGHGLCKVDIDWRFPERIRNHVPEWVERGFIKE